jgi:hypothetical protein
MSPYTDEGLHRAASLSTRLDLTMARFGGLLKDDDKKAT